MPPGTSGWRASRGAGCRTAPDAGSARRPAGGPGRPLPKPPNGRRELGPRAFDLLPGSTLSIPRSRRGTASGSSARRRRVRNRPPLRRRRVSLIPTISPRLRPRPRRPSLRPPPYTTPRYTYHRQWWLWSATLPAGTTTAAVEASARLRRPPPSRLPRRGPRRSSNRPYGPRRRRPLPVQRPRLLRALKPRSARAASVPPNPPTLPPAGGSRWLAVFRGRWAVWSRHPLRPVHARRSAERERHRIRNAESVRRRRPRR